MAPKPKRVKPKAIKHAHDRGAGAKKRTIAAGKALGTPHKTIAQEADVSVRTVEDFGRTGSPEKIAAEVAMIHRFGRRHERALDTLYLEIVESCRKDLTGKQGGVRATARAQGIAMIQASDQYVAPPEEDAGTGQYPPVSLTELLVTFHQAQVKVGGEG